MEFSVIPFFKYQERERKVARVSFSLSKVLLNVRVPRERGRLLFVSPFCPVEREWCSAAVDAYRDVIY